MRKTKNEQKTKPNLDDYAKRLTGTVLFTSSVARANIILLLTIENFATLLCVKFCYVHWISATFGNTVYKPPLAVWHEAV
jgi:hypothetical protein